MTNNTSPRTAHADDLAGARDEALRAHLGDEYDRHLACAGESARYVPENDVADPDAYIVWGYGGDHRALIPARREG